MRLNILRRNARCLKMDQNRERSCCCRVVRGAFLSIVGWGAFVDLVKFIVLVWSGGAIIIVEVCGMSEKGCLVCCPRGEEGRMLLYFLRRILLRLNRDYQPDFTETNESRLLNDHAFPRLLTLLTSTPFTPRHHNPLPKDCQHFRLGRYLRRKLRCDSLTFNELCGQMIQKLAERNYHLSVLELQIKSALETSRTLATGTAYSTLVARVLAMETRSASSPHGYPANHLQAVVCNEQQFIPKGQQTTILALPSVLSIPLPLPLPPHQTN